jgi:colicin import membrane protein
MNAQAIEFTPPPPPKRWSAWVLAILAHLLLIAALSWGVQWNRNNASDAVEAELWTALPQTAAPKLIPPEPAPEPTPDPPPPVPPVQPVPPAPPAPPAPVPKADIAMEREKARQKKQKEDELKALQLKQDKLKEEKLKEEKLKELKLKEQKLRREEEQAKKDEAVAEKLREENLRRINAQAGREGASGAANAAGSALQSSAPSASYAGRIRARIKPNIVFSDEVTGNPMAEVEVRTAPDGTIVGKRLLKSSGVPQWDEAVLSAIVKTEILPKDTDGRVPASLVISFRPKD